MTTKMNEAISGDWTFELHDLARRKADWQRRKSPIWGTKTKAEVQKLRVWDCPLCGHTGTAAFRCDNWTLTCNREHMWKTCHVCYETTASKDPLTNGPACENDCEVSPHV